MTHCLAAYAQHLQQNDYAHDLLKMDFKSIILLL